MSAERDDAIRAIDQGFNEGVKQLYAAFVTGLASGAPESPDDLLDRFRRGLAFECDGHGKTTAAVIDYFAGH